MSTFNNYILKSSIKLHHTECTTVHSVLLHIVRLFISHGIFSAWTFLLYTFSPVFKSISLYRKFRNGISHQVVLMFLFCINV